MPVEQQTQYNSWASLYAGWWIRSAQRLPIPNRTITKLAFFLKKGGSPTGNVTFEIYRVSDNSLIASKVWGDAAALPTTADWCEVTFDAPPTINEEVRICVHYAGGSSDNYVHHAINSIDVKANEYYSYMTGVTWTDLTTYEATYKYTYEVEKPGTAQTAHMAAKMVAAGVI